MSFGSPRRRHTMAQKCTILVIWTVACCCPSCRAFQLSMMNDYRPPVKRTVKKLLDQRYGDNKKESPTVKSAYSGALSMPPFEERMRNPVTNEPATKPIQPRRNLPPNMQIVETLEDYKQVVGDESTKLVVVRFYASYCKACKAVQPHFHKLAHQNPGLKFVDVPVTERNAKLHQGLGIPTLPFIHLYHPKVGLVEEQSFTRKHVPRFRNVLQAYVVGSCDLRDYEEKFAVEP